VSEAEADEDRGAQTDSLGYSSLRSPEPKCELANEAHVPAGGLTGVHAEPTVQSKGSKGL